MKGVCAFTPWGHHHPILSILRPSIFSSINSPPSPVAQPTTTSMLSPFCCNPTNNRNQWEFVTNSLLLFSLLFALSIAPCLTECPRKAAAFRAETVEEGQPGLRPPKQFIQTSFLHRDHDDVDREYAQLLELKIAELRPRLAREALVSVDNENLDCGRADGSHWEHRCREHPQHKPFHFLIVEDSRTGAAVYSLPRERNWAGERRADTLGRLEMALLDALSRHSANPLIGYASEQAAAHVGFVRELSVGELERQMRENQEKQLASESKSAAAAKLSILTRSPLELRLLNERILARRRADFPLDTAALVHFQGPELAEMIDSQAVHAVFVLFWSEASQLDKHSLHIWANSARAWREAEAEGKHSPGPIVLGAVECQAEAEVCRAFGLSSHASSDGHVHQLMAFRDGHRIGQQLAIGEEQFMLEWMRLLLSGPLQRLSNAEQIAAARKGFLPGFSGQRPALTLGLFRDEQQEEFRQFRRVSALLAGRYHLAFALVPEGNDGARLRTLRQPMANRAEEGKQLGMESVDYIGTFDTPSLLHHITHWSVPDIIDIGHGFTTELVIRPEPALLLLHDSGRNPWNGQLREHFLRAGRQLRTKVGRQLLGLLELDRGYSLPLEGFEEAIGLKEQDWPALCILNLHEFRCALGLDAQSLALEGELVKAIGEFLAKTLATIDATAEKMAGTDEAGNVADGTNDHWAVHFPHRGELLARTTQPEGKYPTLSSNDGGISQQKCAPHVPLDLAHKAHPLSQIQLEQIHRLFGPQQIDLPAEPISELTRRSRHPHHFAHADAKAPAISGCPMMAHMNSLRDEL